MDEKLRRWLEARCSAQPDGTWLVQPVAIYKRPPQLAYVLPSGAEKKSYLDQAVHLGRLHLFLQFFAWNCSWACLVWANLDDVLGLKHLSALYWAPAIATVAALLWLLWFAGRAEKLLRGWLDKTGRGVPLGAGRLEEEQASRWWRNERKELWRCRPGWMVVVEVAVVCGLALCVAWLSLVFSERSDCFNAFAAWWAGAGFTRVAGLCALTSFQLLAAASLLVFFAFPSWEWWRWNRRRAQALTNPT